MKAAFLITSDGKKFKIKHSELQESVSNVKYRSSLTKGNTYRKLGITRKSWSISLYPPSAEIKECPVGLTKGQIVTWTLPAGGVSQQRLIIASSVTVDIATGDLMTIELYCVPYRG